MAKESKKNRNKRKTKKNGNFSIFVRNKWNGKEPYSEFMKREFVAWNNLPSTYKQIVKKA